MFPPSRIFFKAEMGSRGLTAPFIVKDHGVIATIAHKRGVYAGAAYSIGTWEYNFNTVAADIARDLRAKIEERGAFVLRLHLRSDIVPEQRPNLSPYKVRIGYFSDT